jgi:thiamine pyrophosphate-dependent acetolactate synthase large subunit-like protein
MKAIKRLLLAIGLSVILTISPTKQSHAIVWVVVQQAIIKVLKAMDLMIQRLQNKTIWLQNAQKTLENTMSKLQLDEITNWVDKHKEQYTKYFDELQKAKELISGYNKVKEIMNKQVSLIQEYKAAFNLSKKDPHFTAKEVTYMLQVYSGIVNESLKNLDLLLLVTNDLSTQMTDGKRLDVVSRVDSRIDENLNDLRLFIQQNAKLSLQRTKDEREIQEVKSMYGIQ